MPYQRFVLLAALMLLQSPDTPWAARTQQTEGVRRVVLERDTVVYGIPCQATRRATAFFASGRLETCSLAEDTEIFGHTFMRGTWLRFTDVGELRSAWLVSDTELQGYVCKGTGFGGWAVDFHRSGQLRLCYLSRQQEIQSIPCRKGSLWGEITGGVQVTFHETGPLESCSAARRIRLDGKGVKAGQRVRLDPAGRLLVDTEAE
jgi:hypothetical protein